MGLSGATEPQAVGLCLLLSAGTIRLAMDGGSALPPPALERARQEIAGLHPETRQVEPSVASPAPGRWQLTFHCQVAGHRSVLRATVDASGAILKLVTSRAG